MRFRNTYLRLDFCLPDQFFPRTDTDRKVSQTFSKKNSTASDMSANGTGYFRFPQHLNSRGQFSGVVQVITKIVFAEHSPYFVKHRRIASSQLPLSLKSLQTFTSAIASRKLMRVAAFSAFFVKNQLLKPTKRARECKNQRK